MVVWKFTPTFPVPTPVGQFAQVSASHAGKNERTNISSERLVYLDCCSWEYSPSRILCALDVLMHLIVSVANAHRRKGIDDSAC
jgi:hypothetical protein